MDNNPTFQSPCGQGRSRARLACRPGHGHNELAGKATLLNTLRITDEHTVQAQNHLLDRRDVLKLGSVAFAASALPVDASTMGEASADSVIYLWMGGGVTHIDTFDPKPDAPEEIRGTLSDQATNVPGIRFSETLPCLAKIADKLSVVRSFSHDSNDHLLSQVYTLSGRKVTRNGLFTEPNIGSLVSHLLGPRNGLPGYIAVPGMTRPGPPPHNLFVGGWLGTQHAPFCVNGRPDDPDFTSNLAGKPLKPDSYADEDLQPRTLNLARDVPPKRMFQRAHLRERLDLMAREMEGRLGAAVDNQYQSALQLLTSSAVRRAFDLKSEPDRLLETYGRTKIGKRCLLARRLVEAGARFVMVDYGYDHQYGNLWDNHNAPGQNFAHICEMVKHGYHVAGIDKAFAALIGDLAQRGMLQRTLVVFLTEFGRTPTINSRGGRDHWGMAGSVFFAGGGVPGGQVIGATDKNAAYPVTKPHSPADLAATIYKALGVPPHGRVKDQLGRPRFIVPDGEPIKEIG